MNNLKLNLLTILFLCCFNNIIYAQNDEGKADQFAEMKELIQSLNLSDNHREKFINIQQDFGEKMQQLKKDNVGKFKMYKEFKKNESTRNEQMRGILTPEQYNIYLEKMEKISRKRRKQGN